MCPLAPLAPGLADPSVELLPEPPPGLLPSSGAALQPFRELGRGVWRSPPRGVALPPRGAGALLVPLSLRTSPPLLGSCSNSWEDW